MLSTLLTEYLVLFRCRRSF